MANTTRTKQWFERINGSKNMLWLLGTLSFLETIILPIPLELVLIPLMAANKQRIWLLATVTTAGCLIASTEKAACQRHSRPAMPLSR